jgi:hypothetical protein
MKGYPGNQPHHRRAHQKKWFMKVAILTSGTRGDVQLIA